MIVDTRFILRDTFAENDRRNACTYIPFSALQLFMYHARDNARFDRSFQHRSAILNTHNDVSDRIWETSIEKGVSSRRGPAIFSLWILEYSRDLRLHRSTESIHPRMAQDKLEHLPLAQDVFLLFSRIGSRDDLPRCSSLSRRK